MGITLVNEAVDRSMFYHSVRQTLAQIQGEEIKRSKKKDLLIQLLIQSGLRGQTG
jgi:hypothetical protein